MLVWLSRVIIRLRSYLLVVALSFPSTHCGGFHPVDEVCTPRAVIVFHIISGIPSAKSIVVGLDLDGVSRKVSCSIGRADGYFFYSCNDGSKWNDLFRVWIDPKTRQIYLLINTDRPTTVAVAVVADGTTIASTTFQPVYDSPLGCATKPQIVEVP